MKDFILSHCNVTSIPQVSYFGNKLKSNEKLSEHDIFVCFMLVAFQSFLCPNSSLQPSSEYMHLFRDPEVFIKYDLSKFVYDWLVISIKKFCKATKLATRQKITLGGNHYILAVSSCIVLFCYIPLLFTNVASLIFSVLILFLHLLFSVC
jgi:hypothetical protein